MIGFGEPVDVATGKGRGCRAVLGVGPVGRATVWVTPGMARRRTGGTVRDSGRDRTAEGQSHGMPLSPAPRSYLDEPPSITSTSASCAHS
jgi:hypothetical protein